MHTEVSARRIWVSGCPIDIWEHPSASFSWTPTAIEGYARREEWASAFNALVLLGDSDPKGMA